MNKTLKQVEKLRQELDLTEQEVAKGIGIRAETYEKWLNEETKPVGKHINNLKEFRDELEERAEKEFWEKGEQVDVGIKQKQSDQENEPDQQNEEPNQCKWDYQKYFGYYITDCNKQAQMQATQLNYCPFCGKEILLDK